jgi:hypothetical protein
LRIDNEVTFVTHTSATDVFDPDDHNKVVDSPTAATSVLVIDPGWMDIGMKRTIAVCVVLLATVVTAAAESPVAIVEEVQGKVTGAEFMDYLTPKMVIKLGANSSIVISYLKSCRREKIDGIGTVIIGTDESLVHLASVKDEKTECDASHAHATTRETSEVAATVVRSIAKNDIAIKPQLTLYGAGGIYSAKFRSSQIVFQIDARARPGMTPIVGRLVRMD